MLVVTLSLWIASNKSFLLIYWILDHFLCCCSTATSSLDANYLNILWFLKATGFRKQFNYHTLLKMVNRLLHETPLLPIMLRWSILSCLCTVSHRDHLSIKESKIFSWGMSFCRRYSLIMVSSAVATRAYQPVNVTNPAWPPIIKSTVIDLIILAQVRPQWTVRVKNKTQ